MSHSPSTDQSVGQTHRPVKLRVVRAVHDPHAAAPDLLLDPVRPDRLRKPRHRHAMSISDWCGMPAVNDIIGPYRLEREIGRGGMGIAFLSHDTRLDRPVAIEALPDDLARATLIQERPGSRLAA